MEDWWKREMIYRRAKDVLAAEYFTRWMDSWMEGWMAGWMDGWLEGWMGLMMAACHVSRQCFDNKSFAMASLLSCLCLFCHLLVWGEWGQFNRSRVLSLSHTHVHTHMHTHSGVTGSVGMRICVLSVCLWLHMCVPDWLHSYFVNMWWDVEWIRLKPVVMFKVQ